MLVSVKVISSTEKVSINNVWEKMGVKVINVLVQILYNKVVSFKDLEVLIITKIKPNLKEVMHDLSNSKVLLVIEGTYY